MPAQRRRRPVEDEESEEDARPRQRNRAESDDEDEQEPSEAEMDGDHQHAQNADHQLAKKLVRYALSCEFSRTVIRRDGIKERAMKANSQPKLGSGAYILTSTLPEAYRSAAILGPSKTPSADDEATYVGFYTMVISLILLSGGELSEQKLKRHLLRLNADQNVSMDRTEVILKKMERQGYVIKRVERPPLGQDGEPTTTWHVGPRGKEEVGLEGVMGMTREIYGDSWDEDLEKKLRASLNIREAAQQDVEDGDEAAGEASRMQE
ncbi:Non-structural maintenance of chromosome element 3 [Fusarium austroafricanum]|uniref:Non-structural maintenance of chromosome element 3 n=1 Tax=Fusarium austroafricanum TaxID=2364996 RepID=A0A8H4K8I3_9HYPO|nr:Non-structural maintenance of chromosome element 3 [Fusarium austroafricanum]